MKDLREVTREAGAALILDEVVTGFRIHPGGAQAVYDVEADIVTYGKAVGAGVPVGVVSGKATYLDGLDGGMWRYGDRSYPQAESTTLPGTYFKHPLTIPAVCAVLEHYQQNHAQEEESVEELPFWRAQSPSPPSPIPVDHDLGPNNLGSSQTVSIWLGAEETKQLHGAAVRTFRAQVSEIVLTAAVRACQEWTKKPFLHVDLESHGREDLFDQADLSRTVGWFTCIYPVLLKLQEQEEPSTAVAVIQDQLRLVPRGGIGFGLLRYLNQDPQVYEPLRAAPNAEILFDYMGGHLGAARSPAKEPRFKPAFEPTGPAADSHGIRLYVLEIEGLVLQGKLQLRLNYSENLHRRETIEELGQGILEALKELLAYSKG